MNEAITTTEQEEDWRKVFCGYAAMGVACGLEHRYEWFSNAMRSTIHGEWSKIAEEERRIANAFLSFEKTTACCPEEDRVLQSMSIQGYLDRVDRWYEVRGRRNAS